MKKVVLSIAVLILALATWASTVTIHGCKDNYLILNYDDSNWSAQLVWDWTWDNQNPDSIWSGEYTWTFYPEYSEYWSGGYADTLTLSIPSQYGYCSYGEIAGPNYENRGNRVYLSTPNSGEVWVDFSEDGNARISISQPADFGKWAWDGSVNPSWIEPTPPMFKKQHGKGHFK